MKLIAAVLLAGFLLSGCSGQRTGTGVEVYTFQQPRVDQELDGNRGYIEGTPPPVTGDRKGTRTLIGVDIELPSGGVSEEGISEIESEKMQRDPKECASEPEKTSQTKTQEPEPVQKEEPIYESSEEEWIK